MVTLGYGDYCKEPVLKYDTIDKIVLDRIQTGSSNQNMIITDAIVLKGAEKTAENLGLENFRNSSGWLEKFEKKNLLFI